MAGSMNGKVALVTGAGSGIGRSSALAFAREGAKVVVSDINDDGGLETVQLIQSAGGEAVYARANVAKGDEVEAMVAKAVETFGRLDCALNNAGYVGNNETPPDAYTEEAWSKVIHINLTGAWLCMKYELQQMLKQGSGSIVNMASIAGLIGIPNAAYTASKHGVVGLTKATALSYAKQGIRVNAVCPAYIATPMVAEVVGGDPDLEAYLNSAQPIGRMGTPEEVAESVLWLCSDAASFMTGHALAIDGGYCAQ